MKVSASRRLRLPIAYILVGVLIATVAIACSACASSGAVPSAPSVASGVVDGTLTLRGGCALCTNPRPLPGTVRLLGAHGHIDVKVGKSGRFAARVPVGRYQVEAGLNRPYDWPIGSCGLPPSHGFSRQWGSITVQQGNKQHVHVTCVAA
jgi:hypothetical protein